MKFQKKTYCSNCGCFGHYIKSCISPVTSYGCIVYKLPEGFNQSLELLKDSTSLSGLEKISKEIKYLLIQRRDSIGFIEIMRGKYKLSDIEYIRYHIASMTSAEHKKLLNDDFDTLWFNLWGLPKEQSINYRNDKENARIKFEALRKGIKDASENTITLESLVSSVEVHWSSPEWGFPKGRRDPHESDLRCALRELYEETGVLENDVLVIKNLEPISETFFGSNHVNYCHKYYLLEYNSSKDLVYDINNPYMRKEIGDLQWCSLEECLTKIRPDNIEKKEVLLRASSLLRNYCPLRMF